MPDNDSPQHPAGPEDHRSSHPGVNDYFARRRRQAARARGPQRRGANAPQRAASRYAAYSAPRSERTRRQQGRVSPAPAATPLQAEFRMAQEVQAEHRRPGNRLRTLRRKRWFWPLVGVPGILAIVAVIALSPVLWSTFQAYRNVTVDSVEHLNSAFVPQLNVQGTPELVARPTQEAETTGWNGTDPLTILLLGVDIAAGGASRTDTLILVSIDPEDKSATMMSIPRDMKAVIPGYGVHKINAAFALGEFNEVQGGGAGLTIRTIESNLGIPVHGFVQIDFQGFTQMIDTVGGVIVDVPYPLRDDEYPAENYAYQRIYFPAGWQHLDGEEALVYARTRHQDGDSMRSARQQQVLVALRDQAMSLDIVGQLPTLIRQFGDSVRTDISINDAVKLAQLGLDIPRDRIASMSLLPALYEDPGEDGTYYLSADWSIATDILTEFAGKPISPPGAAIANPDYSVTIMILNGTTNTGLAGRVGTTLEQNGFWNVSVDYAENQGDHDESLIVDHDSNLATSAMISSLIGVGADTIVLGDPDPNADDGTDQYSDYDIVVMLGNDAPDPAGDQWTLEDYQRETGEDEPSNVAPTEETAAPDGAEAAPAGEERELNPVDEEGE